MKISDTTFLLETAQRIDAIQKEADAKKAEEYKSLVRIFQELHGVGEAEAQYLIFQADVRLKVDDYD